MSRRSSTVVLVGAAILLMASAAGAEVVVLENGGRLEGEVLERTETHLRIRIRYVNEDAGGGSIEMTGERNVKWSDIASIDGMSIADWMRGDPEPTEETVEAPTETLTPRTLLERFAVWLEEGEGFDFAFRLGSLALLVLLPGVLILLGSRVMGIEHIEGIRSFGAAIVGLGGAAAALETWPVWVGDWPLTPIAAAALLVLLVLRPPAGRGVVLACLHLVGMAGAIVGTLAVAGRLT